MSTDVAVYQGNQFSREQLDVMRQTVAAGTSNAEFALFLEVCKHRKLNPFNREIYVIPGKNGKMTFQVSIDGLRLLAERSGKYQGQIGPLWCGKDGEWKEVWLEDAPPAAAKVGVIRSDFKEPIFSVAKYKSYVGASPIWQKMPDLMLAKCAESLALRRAFPDQMAGLYTREEMMQADSEHDLPAQVLAQETAQETITVEPEVIEPERWQASLDRAEALRELARPGPARAGKNLQIQAQPADEPPIENMQASKNRCRNRAYRLDIKTIAQYEQFCNGVIGKPAPETLADVNKLNADLEQREKQPKTA